MYAGGQFTYGFLTDFLSGMLMRLGFSLQAAFIIPSLILTFLLLLGMYVLLSSLLRSKGLALLAISLFFLSSGLGFLSFFNDFAQNPSLESLLFPAQEYSRVDEQQWYAGNVVVGMLVPQRAFLLGMVLAVWAFIGFFRARRTSLFAAGIGAGLLPIAHMHTFLVVVAITGLLSLVSFRKWKLLLYYVVPATLLSSLLYFLFIHGGIENQDEFFTWYPGWTIKDGFVVWTKTWLQFWGPMIPLAVFGWFILRKKTSHLVQVFFLSFFLLFAGANLILIQPIPWDNAKIFLWAYFGFSGLSAVALAWLWRKRLVGKMLSILLIFILTFTGVLELIRLQRIDQNQILETNADNIQLGLQIREQTDPLSVFLVETTHNHFVMMWGARPILMGYTAWVWNFGFDYKQREKDIKTMFQGNQGTEELLAKYNIHYVVIGPGELNVFAANEQYFSSRFPVAFENQQYRIYDVKK